MIEQNNNQNGQVVCPSIEQDYHPLKPSFIQNPYPFYQQARNQEPIFWSKELTAWVVTRYDDVRYVLSHADLFSSRDALRPTVAFTPEVFAILSGGYHFVSNTLTSDGGRHKAFRRPLNKAFEQRRVSLIESEVRRVAHRLVDGFDDGKADIITQFANILPLEILLSSWFGLPISDLGQCKRWSDDMEALFQSPLSPEQQAECARSYVAFQHYLAAIIKERRKAPGDDVISLMIEEDSLNEDDLVIGLVGVLLAGHETTASLIGNAVSLFLNHKDSWQKLSDHPDLIPPAIEEVLRYDGSVAGFYRTALRQSNVGGATIPEGALLLVLYGSANHDETQFHHAEQFDPLRSTSKHLAFGHGTHMCAGAPLARLECCIALAVLTQRLPHLCLVDQPLVRPRLQFRGFEHLLVTWDKSRQSISQSFVK